MDVCRKRFENSVQHGGIVLIQAKVAGMVTEEDILNRRADLSYRRGPPAWGIRTRLHTNETISE